MRTLTDLDMLVVGTSDYIANQLQSQEIFCVGYGFFLKGKVMLAHAFILSQRESNKTDRKEVKEVVELRIDPEFEALIPPLTADEFNQLRENILEVKEVYDPILTWNGVIVDGHNRWKIIREHPEVSFKVTEVIFFNRNEAILWIINNQLGRRNLEKSDAIDLAEKKAEVTAQMAKAKQSEAGKTFGVGLPKKEEIASVQMDKTYSEPINTREEIAKTAGVSTGTVARYQEVKKKAPEFVPKIKSGEMTIGGAYKAVKEEEKAKEPPKPVAAVAIDLASDVNDITNAFITTVRTALTSHSTLLTDKNKPEILEALARAKEKIEEIEKLLK